MQLATVRERGIALIITLLTMVVVAGIGTLLFARTVNEIKHSGDDAAIVQTLLLARGGANLGGSLLGSDIRDELDSIVNVRSSTTTCWSFGSGSCSSPAPSASSVVADLTGSNSVATQLQDRIDALLCDTTLDQFGENADVRLRVFVTSSTCGDSLPAGITLPQGRFVSGMPRPSSQDYAIPFVMVSEATLGDYKRNVVLQGEYRFTVGRVTFAQYALFTNNHKTQAGDDIWFTKDTLFDGPVHTNEYFRFYANPWFGHKVTSAGCPINRRGTRTNPSTGEVEEYCRQATAGAYFFNSSTLRTNLGASPSYGSNPVNKPELSGGVDWGAEYVPLPSNSYEQEQEALRNGLHFGEGVNLKKLEIWAADASGQLLVAKSGGGWQSEAVYQYYQAEMEVETTTTVWGCIRYYWWGGCRTEGYVTTTTMATETPTYRSDAAGVLEKLDTTVTPNVWRPVLNSEGQAITHFNGVIYVDGGVDRFLGPTAAGTGATRPNASAPAVAAFSQLTLAAKETVRITGDLKYESPPCSSSPTRGAGGTVVGATCENLDATNVLGVYAESANILIGHNNGYGSPLNAPDNVTIHAVLMAGKGIVGVEDFRSGTSHGTVNLLGGIIENDYGGFGTFNTATGNMSTGYSRTFTYDQRMYSTVSPPYFPTIGLDKVKHVLVYSFGQREQVY